MYGSGVAIGMAITRHRHRTTLRAPARANTGCFVGAVGAIVLATAVFRAVSTTRHLSVTAIAAFGLFAFLRVQWKFIRLKNISVG